ncbi:MAG TPA: peptidoglycan-binding domain-containing protein [Fimbriiglobus sp.]|jgi:peptidoglycan hydrolase-like protein with peptidoglycan-binding domain|nr:peptidoglycan-binding domain-containing protein [Fimbriiglobus sp.]
MLKQGAVGNGVAAVQFALNRAARGAPDWTKPALVCDGIFGPLTLARVLDHQKRENLVPDGIVGPLTLDTLFTKVSLRSTVQITRTDVEPTSHKPSGSMPPSMALHAAQPILRRPAPLRLDPPGPRPLRTYPDLSTWLSPSLAELARQQQAFRTWLEKPPPKPPLPAPLPYSPRIPWDQVFAQYTWVFPSPKKEVVVPGPPAPAAQRSVLVDRSGLELTTRIETEVKFQRRQVKYKWFELEVEFEATLPKSRFGELKASRSLAVSRDHQGVGYEAKSTLSLTQAKRKLWDSDRTWLSAGVLEMSAEIAAAIVLESAILAAEVEVQQKAALEVSVIRRAHETGLTLGIGIGTGATGRVPILVMRPGRDPEEEKVSVMPFFLGNLYLLWRY